MTDCRAPAELGASSQRHPAVSKLLKAMHSPDASRRAHALDKLSEVIGAAYGEAGAEVGQAVRNGSGIALLARLLADPYPQVQQQALFVVGNLCSASVDAGSDETKKLLLQHGAGRSLIAHAFSDDRYTLTLACGALQNLCGRGESDSDGHDREWSKLVVQVCRRSSLRACACVRRSPVPFPHGCAVRCAPKTGGPCGERRPVDQAVRLWLPEQHCNASAQDHANERRGPGRRQAARRDEGDRGAAFALCDGHHRPRSVRHATRCPRAARCDGEASSRVGAARRRWLAASAPQRFGRVVALVQLLCECLHVHIVRQRRIDAVGEHASPREAGIRPEPLIDDGACPPGRVLLENAFELFCRSLKHAYLNMRN